MLATRLSNAEYNYTIRDLTGVDIRPAREFPVDPANPAGFDNSGESLSMSPALLKQVPAGGTRSREPHGAEAGRHRVRSAPGAGSRRTAINICVNQIVDFYHRQDTDYAHYFLAAWRYKHRDKPRATLADFAAADRVSPKYLAADLAHARGSKEEIGPLAKLQQMWRELPSDAKGAQDGCGTHAQLRGAVALEDRAAVSGSRRLRDLANVAAVPDVEKPPVR